ncbi:hypothetical protein BCF11_2493 [Collimonas sp. PA-H2]|uniref:hypothetical protein n=1 Tax=Collimonas sp. PA-H2 TaxID=1881062 RepID=UPI000BF3A937|nr:hypothetical protein [Collimonas sp. PA-H2]PFH10084.1 hypothetical protein BCF11_2493 [Collimonas sp. PA-H2]
MSLANLAGVSNDNAGAPASNAGDRFHELWALRQALSLLDPDSTYQAMTVEGVPLMDTNPAAGSWDAVDVCLMAGGDRRPATTRKTLSQFGTFFT